ELPPYHRPFFRSFVLSGWSFVLLALVIFCLLVFAIRLLLEAGRSRVVGRVRAFSADPEAESKPKNEDAKREEWRKRAARARVSSSSAAQGWMGKLDEQRDVGRIGVSSMTIIVLT